MTRGSATAPLPRGRRPGQPGPQRPAGTTAATGTPARVTRGMTAIAARGTGAAAGLSYEQCGRTLTPVKTDPGEDRPR
jgi:hypothetical protein